MGAGSHSLLTVGPHLLCYVLFLVVRLVLLPWGLLLVLLLYTFPYWAGFWGPNATSVIMSPLVSCSTRLVVIISGAAICHSDGQGPSPWNEIKLSILEIQFKINDEFKAYKMICEREHEHYTTFKLSFYAPGPPAWGVGVWPPIWGS